MLLRCRSVQMNSLDQYTNTPIHQLSKPGSSTTSPGLFRPKTRQGRSVVLTLTFGISGPCLSGRLSQELHSFLRNQADRRLFPQEFCHGFPVYPIPYPCRAITRPAHYSRAIGAEFCVANKSVMAPHDDWFLRTIGCPKKDGSFINKG